MKNAKIMIVEDEAIIAKDIQNRLKKLGYAVVGVVSSGEEAIHKAAETFPDLILMDIHLKGNIDGVEAARQIRNHLNVPIIYLTAYADDSTLERAKVTEASSYLLKPFKERELYTNIEIALAKHQIETKKTLDKEKKLDDLKASFITTASHEFRTPLAIISSSAGILEGYSHKLTEEKKRKHLNRIQTSVEHITSLLDDALLINQLDKGELNFQPEPLDLADFSRDFIESYQDNIVSSHKVDFEIFGVSAEQSINACMDKNLLRPILAHLLSNAIKFSPNGATIHFNLILHQEVATFKIRDEGIGIPLEDQEKLFETFYRAKNVGNIPGTGLGLSVVKKCVDLHKGKITVESELGASTTFTVSIPLHGTA